MVSTVPAVAQVVPDSALIRLSFDTRVPMRDGKTLSATLYRPRDQVGPAPCVISITPYIADAYHIRGTYFAARGLPFLMVNSRGRGDSDGTFQPFEGDGRDGYDAVEWLAAQPYCNGKVAMWGGSYGGFNQWATARESPPHLATIVPVASPYFGADAPGRSNIPINYMLQWMLYTKGRTVQTNAFADPGYWNAIWRERFETGKSFATLADQPDHREPLLKEWAAHPHMDAYWDRKNPTAAEYRAMAIPILTITGSYDDDQPGTIAHYRAFMAAASPEDRARHYLVIGPWDHTGTRTPKPDYGGVPFGAESLVDLPALHVDWYRWTMAGGAKPAFLKKRVAWYVMGANRWRYADSLDAVTAEHKPFYLDSTANADRVLGSGRLDPAAPGQGRPDSYAYDPRDVSLAGLEASLDQSSLVDQRLVLARDGKQLVYHSAPFDKPTEVSGFFRFSAWISIDQPDTDFQASVYEITPDGGSILLSMDYLRARHRESLRTEKLVTTTAPLRYDFDRFTFVSREVAAGSRLRLVIAPVNSIHLQKNYNAPGPVAMQTIADARTATVRLLHDRAHPSALFVPIGRVGD
ncbi:CocE/NonD family hydrolase [Sphingobium algorifonticola]|nr:CocE/NonD family hydrolase [Sphingobium algorifonticola]